MNKPIDDAWLAEIGTLARYAGIDLAEALRKCRLWANAGKQPTRKKFISFLNKNYPVRRDIFQG
jgi:hypothetical protein